MNKTLFTLGAALLLVPGVALADGHGMKKGHGGKYGGKNHSWENSFEAMDKDGNGSVSWDEYKAKKEEKIKATFDYKDINKDGSITLKEIEEAHNMWRKKHVEDMKAKGVDPLKLEKSADDAEGMAKDAAKDMKEDKVSE